MPAEPDWLKEARERGLLGKVTRVNTQQFTSAAAANCGPGTRVAIVPDALPADIAEEDFQDLVVLLAENNGWLAYHTRDSRGSQKGFFDLVLVRERLVFAELKSATGRQTPEQKLWERRVVAACGSRCHCHLWTPDHWPVIVKILTAPPPEDYAP